MLTQLKKKFTLSILLVLHSQNIAANIKSYMITKVHKRKQVKKAFHTQSILFANCLITKTRHGLLLYIQEEKTLIQLNTVFLFPVPHADGLAAADLFLQLKDSIEESLCRRRAARYIYIHRYNPVTATHHRV